MAPERDCPRSRWGGSFRPLLHASGMLLLLGAMTGCSVGRHPAQERVLPERVLRLATTPLTAGSGLLEAILPAFEGTFGARVEVIAEGYGEAFALGEQGRADVLLVHDRTREDAFVEQGFGTFRRDVMTSDFVIVGPSADPASVGDLETVCEALTAIPGSGALFVSTGPESDTYDKETALWEGCELSPVGESWYRSLGRSMIKTLIYADEIGAYALSDRQTFVTLRAQWPALVLLVGGASITSNPESSLMNRYAVIPVNDPEGRSSSGQLALDFVEWITGPTIQRAIGQFGVERSGQPLFVPARAHGAVRGD